MDRREVSVFQNCKMSQAAQNLTAVLEGGTKNLPQLWLDFLKVKAFSARVCVIVVCVVINFLSS